MTGKIPNIGSSAGMLKETKPSVFFPQEISTEIALHQSQGLSNQRQREKTPKTSKVEPDSKAQPTEQIDEINPIREKTLILEYQLLQKYSPVGMFCIPKPDTGMSEWHGVYLCKQGIYSEAVLKFRLDFPKQYPKQMPRVLFTTPVFHPLVDH